MIQHFTRARLITAALVLVLLLVLWWAFQPPRVIVDAAEVKRGEFAVSISEEGRTRVDQRYRVTAPVAGHINRVTLEPGDRVEAGQVLFVLTPLDAALLDPRNRAQAESKLAEAEAVLQSARAYLEAERARLELAESNYRRAREVAERGLLAEEALRAAESQLKQSRADLERAQFQVQVAEYQKASAQAVLDRQASGSTEQIAVRAPVDGVVLKRFRESEGAVLQGQEVLEIGDPTSIEVEVDVLSSQAVKIEPGMPVVIDRWGGEAIKGQVERVEPAGFTKYSALGVEEQRVWVIVRLELSDLWRNRLGDGFRVEAEFYLWQGKHVLQAPSSALFREDGQWYVYVVEGGRAQKRRVEPGPESGLWRAIDDGLAEGEQVVTHPGERLQPGVVVELRSQARAP